MYPAFVRGAVLTAVPEGIRRPGSTLCVVDETGLVVREA